MEPLMYRVSEAAAVIGLSKSLVYRLVLADEIPHVRVGRSVRIPRAALEEWIAHQQHGGGMDRETARKEGRRAHRT